LLPLGYTKWCRRKREKAAQTKAAIKSHYQRRYWLNMVEANLKSLT
jgi:hypothetical protein